MNNKTKRRINKIIKKNKAINRLSLDQLRDNIIDIFENYDEEISFDNGCFLRWTTDIEDDELHYYNNVDYETRHLEVWQEIKYQCTNIVILRYILRQLFKKGGM